MAKKKPPAKKKSTKAKKTKGVASLTVSVGCFVKISTYSYNDVSGDITVTAAYRIPAGITVASATISYIDIVNDSTGSSAATVGTNTITGTINLPDDSIYLITITLVDSNGDVASDSFIYNTADDSTGLQDTVGIGPPPP